MIQFSYTYHQRSSKFCIILGLDIFQPKILPYYSYVPESSCSLFIASLQADISPLYNITANKPATPAHMGTLTLPASPIAIEGVAAARIEVAATVTWGWPSVNCETGTARTVVAGWVAWGLGRELETG